MPVILVSMWFSGFFLRNPRTGKRVFELLFLNVYCFYYKRNTFIMGILEKIAEIESEASIIYSCSMKFPCFQCAYYVY